MSEKLDAVENKISHKYAAFAIANRKTLLAVMALFTLFKILTYVMIRILYYQNQTAM